MAVLFCTADDVGSASGGGTAASHQLEALRAFCQKRVSERRDISYADLVVLDRKSLSSDGPEPWKWDEAACYRRDWAVLRPRLAVFYSGTFSKTVEILKRNGCKVTYHIDAHDKEISRNEHQKLGWPFPYPHLVEEPIWQRYIEGYRLADVITTSGSVPKKTIQNYGPDFEKKDIRIIPHGCHLPKEIKPLPDQFVVQYCGSWGADKGIRYLLEAWKNLNYRDGSVLMIGGRDSCSLLAKHLLQRFGGGNIYLAGWQENMEDFYAQGSVYIQPSASEGFGLEILEAMACGRTVLCSDAAGAVDVIPEMTGCRFRACDVEDLANKIDWLKRSDLHKMYAPHARAKAEEFTWDKIHSKYLDLWEGLVG